MIRQANSAQEREALEKARDEAIAEMRRQIDAIDEEIRQLREKNAALEKELAETEKLLASTRAKLANEGFVSKAPAAVVDGVRTREAELAELADRLRANLGG